MNITQYLKENISANARWFTTIGIVFVLVAFMIPCTACRYEVWINLIAGLATACFVAGLIDVFISKAQQQLFTLEVGKQIKETVVEGGFVKKLDDTELDTVLLKILSKQTGRDEEFLDYPDSFYNCFGQTFKDILAGPYRDEVRCTVVIQEDPPNSGNFTAKEHLWYRCMVSAGEDGHIQDKIEYKLTGIMATFVTLTRCKVVARDSGGTLLGILRDSTNTTQPINGIVNGRQIQSIDLATEFPLLFRHNRLEIDIDAEYTIDPRRILAWRLSDLADKLTFTIIAPHGYDIDYSIFAGRTSVEKPKPGQCVLSSQTWMFPGDGFVYRIVPNILPSDDGITVLPVPEDDGGVTGDDVANFGVVK
ncbi:MAG: hypothetical protein LBI05_10070 [Planctomycetaceae bacterium]|jgi:hypothetical protein|nr:hypothetical protein [Planctomycetaceae bacterium]